MPRRIQRSRAKGYRLPPGAIYVGRPSKWGNPFGDLPLLAYIGPSLVKLRGKSLFAADTFRLWLAGDLIMSREVEQLQARRWFILTHVRQLKGHDLACWCRDRGEPTGTARPDERPESAPPDERPKTLPRADAIDRPRIRVLPDGRVGRNDAAKYLGCKSKTLAMWQMQGKGPKHLKVGGRVFYYLSDLEAFAQTGRDAVIYTRDGASEEHPDT